MTQRIFDKDNKKDMDDLWDILPNDVNKIKKHTDELNHFYKGADIIFTSLIKINWHDATEITRPVNYKDMVGCVGWFWDDDDEEIKLGVLIKVVPNDEEGYCFLKDNNVRYKNFRPAKKSELKFWEENEE